MQRTTRFFWIVCLLLLAVVPFVQAQDEGDSVGIPLITAGEPITRAFSGNITAHLYAFEGTAGDVVSISMTQPADSELDPFLVLLGARGQVIASDDDSGAEPFFAALIDSVTLPEDGAYFIVASSFIYIDALLDEASADLTEEQSYELLLQGANVPASDTSVDSFDYFAGTLEFEAESEGASTPEEPVFFYTFEATEGDIIDITLESDEFDTLLYVIGKDGERLAVNDDDSESFGTNSAIRSFEVPATGRYLVFATDIFYYSAGDEESSLEFTGGTFKIKLSKQQTVG